MAGEHTGPHLYLVADPAPATATRLEAVFAATPVSTLMLRLPASRAADAVELKSLIECAQAKGIAALLSDDARLARTLRADGVHLTNSGDVAARYAEAREILGTRYIIGVDVGLSRHDAMTVGEAGADYIAFSLPPDGGIDAEEALLDHVEWWNEIFEVPCVVFGASDPADAHMAAAAGADFVAVALPSAASAADAAETVAGFAAALPAMPAGV